MKKALFALCTIVFALNVKAQILTRSTTPSTIALQVPGYSQVTTINTRTFSYTPSTPDPTRTPVDDDTTTEDPKLYRYADMLPVSITMANGNITSTSVGKVWTLRISIPNALNIGLNFNQFNLSTSAEMYIFNEARTVLKGAIKKAHFTSSNVVGASSMTGNSIIVYIVEPNNFGTLQSIISIQKLAAGFRKIGDVGNTGGTVSTLGTTSTNSTLGTATINCNPHVLCRTDKMVAARAVARFSSNGHQCTGTLLNNEISNGRAFFLTAFHCLDVNDKLWPIPDGNGVIDQAELDALATATFQFQFWRTQCNGTTNNEFIEFSGAVLRAAWRNSDVVLLG